MPVDRETDSWLYEMWQRHMGKVLGSVCGLMFALTVMVIGLWWTLFLMVCIIAGYLVGRYFDSSRQTIAGWLESVFSRSDQFH